MDRRFYLALTTLLLALIAGAATLGRGAAQPASAQASGSATEQGQTKQPLQPLESVLNEDGTLDLQSGFRGSVDPRGWRMASAPGDKPRFVRDAPVGALLAAPSAPSEGDENWDGRFALPGLSGQVLAIAISDTDVYVGGWFSTAGGVNANRIARWDTTANRWYSLGSGPNNGVDGIVNAIAVSGTNVYVGGDFQMVGGVSANHIARWDSATQQWHPLGRGVSAVENVSINAIAISGNDVYVAGEFTTAGEINANNIAKWDTIANKWYPLVSDSTNGLNGSVHALATLGTSLFVGGTFSMAGGVSASNIARWDISSGQWYSLGTGVSGASSTVHALATLGTDVYVGGYFHTAGGVRANMITRWDSVTQQWHPLGSGSANGVNRDVYALATIGNDVYVGGLFTTAGGVGASRIAGWDTLTSQWHVLGSGSANGVDSSIHAIAVSGANVYAGGYPTIAGKVSASYIARWNTDTSRWHPLQEDTASNGASGGVSAIAVSGSDVYVGGLFTTVGGVIASHIARWDVATNRWYPLGSGVNFGPNDPWGEVYAITINGTDVYVGGVFTTAGGVGASNIARWNSVTQQWHPLGSDFNNGVNRGVYAIAISGTDVYVGGHFITAGGTPANRIARWDNTTGLWYPLSSDATNGVNNEVLDIAVNGTDVYVGGAFTAAGGAIANRIARWNSVAKQWYPLGSGSSNGVNNRVYAIAANGTDMYVGGSFTTAGGVGANGIARLDTATGQWYPLGSGVNPNDPWVYAIAVNRTDVYVGGEFTTAGGMSAGNIARWDTLASRWIPLGRGLRNDESVWDIGFNRNNIYVGGVFTIAGNKPSNYFAVWHEPCPITFTDVQPSDYFYNAVRYLYCRGAVSGYQDNTFRPYNSTTRGQLSKIVVLAEGWPIQNPPQPHFVDVSNSHPFYTFVETAYTQGVISGYADGTFRPDNNVTRAQLCKIVALSEGWDINTQGGPHFSDVPASDPFYAYVETAYNRGVVSGYSDNTFRPGNPATRGQISKIVHSAVTQP